MDTESGLFTNLRCSIEEQPVAVLALHLGRVCAVDAVHVPLQVVAHAKVVAKVANSVVVFEVFLLHVQTLPTHRLN